MSSFSSKQELSTLFPPSKPTLIWDKECDFCKYWIIKWQLIIDKENIDVHSYQEIADNFADLDKKLFKKAVRLITPNGNVYSGAEAAFKSLEIGEAANLPINWYKKHPSFAELSEWLYKQIAAHRPFLYDISHFFLGKNPTKVRPSIWLWIGASTLIGASLFLKLRDKK